jgi:hypothetical protein
MELKSEPIEINESDLSPLQLLRTEISDDDGSSQQDHSNDNVETDSPMIDMHIFDNEYESEYEHSCDNDDNDYDDYHYKDNNDDYDDFTDDNDENENE